jgi:2-polyprenyl-3-methyl-5-hydroxy-6-metoxy-1,4-benzoquinol methylase
MVDRMTCLVCGSENSVEVLSPIDYTVSKKAFPIRSCSDCGFWWTSSIPLETEIGAYYQSEDYVSHSNSSKGLINFLYLKVRNFTLKQKMRWIHKRIKKGALLDVGSGTGHFLKQAKIAGWNVCGLEPDKNARNIAKSTNALDLQPIESLYHLENGSFDVVTMWHVLEHVYHLEKDVNQLSKLIKSGGFIYVAVPNRNSYDAKHYGAEWAAYDVPRHLYHFRAEDVIAIMERNQLTYCQTIPMRFDAYYVSMLSEKIKGGSFLKALWIGFKSNRKAKKHGYSSQVYVFRKV